MSGTGARGVAQGGGKVAKVAKAGQSGRKRQSVQNPRIILMESGIYGPLGLPALPGYLPLGPPEVSLSPKMGIFRVYLGYL